MGGTWRAVPIAIPIPIAVERAVPIAGKFCTWLQSPIHGGAFYSVGKRMRVPGNQFAGADRIGPAPVNYHRLLARTWEPIEFPGFSLPLTGCRYLASQWSAKRKKGDG